MIRQVSVVVLGIVVPYVGTWIEIALSCSGWVSAAVVPYVGTWIEILHPLVMNNGAKGRSLRGNVDRNTSMAAACEVDQMSFPTWERG